LTAGPGVVLDDVGDVGVLVDSETEELEPVGWRNVFDVVLSDITHKEELALEEFAVHLISLNSQEAAEAAYGFGMETFAGVGPGEGVCKVLVPCFDEGQDILAELLDREEVTVFEALTFEDAEPYLNHVQPRGMERDEVNHDAFVFGR